MPLPTLLDIKKLNDGVGFDIVEENVLLCPELRVIPAEVINGTDMKLTVRTDLPTIGFRNLNEGTPRSKSKYDNRVFSCADISGQIAVDLGVYNRATDKPRFLTGEASGFMEAAFRHCAKQFWYGVNNDAKGFPGVIAQMLADAAHEVDATGAAAKSSVFMVRIARETLQFLFGNGTTIDLLPQWREETVYDANANPFQAITNWMNGQVGARLANRHAVVRVKNIGTAAGKTLTDAMLFDAAEKFETACGAPPTHLFMTPRSVEQLRKSRTPTNQKGDPVPLPTTWETLPIVRSSAISNDEAI